MIGYSDHHLKINYRLVVIVRSTGKGNVSAIRQGAFSKCQRPAPAPAPVPAPEPMVDIHFDVVISYEKFQQICSLGYLSAAMASYKDLPQLEAHEGAVACLDQIPLKPYKAKYNPSKYKMSSGQVIISVPESILEGVDRLVLLSILERVAVRAERNYGIALRAANPMRLVGGRVEKGTPPKSTHIADPRADRSGYQCRVNRAKL
jgi:hypothetical protein